MRQTLRRADSLAPPNITPQAVPHLSAFLMVGFFPNLLTHFREPQPPQHLHFCHTPTLGYQRFRTTGLGINPSVEMRPLSLGLCLVFRHRIPHALSLEELQPPGRQRPRKTLAPNHIPPTSLHTPSYYLTSLLPSLVLADLSLLLCSDYRA